MNLPDARARCKEAVGGSAKARCQSLRRERLSAGLSAKGSGRGRRGNPSESAPASPAGGLGLPPTSTTTSSPSPPTLRPSPTLPIGQAPPLFRPATPFQIHPSSPALEAAKVPTTSSPSLNASEEWISVDKMATDHASVQHFIGASFFTSAAFAFRAQGDGLGARVRRAQASLRRADRWFGLQHRKRPAASFGRGRARKGPLGQRPRPTLREWSPLALPCLPRLQLAQWPASYPLIGSTADACMLPFFSRAALQEATRSTSRRPLP